MKTTRRPRRGGAKRQSKERPEIWRLRLYVADGSPKSHVALLNLQRLCEQHLSGRYTIDVVDLRANPARARNDEIVAVPTLVRRLPAPIRKIVGDLSSDDRTLIGLQLR